MEKTLETRNINGEILTLEEAEKKNSKLIWSMVQRFKIRGEKLGMEPNDLYNLAAIGFIKAFNNFNPEEYAVRFSTYAVPMMVGELQRWFRDNAGDLKFGRKVIELANKIGIEDLADEKKETIANHFDVTLKEVNAALECIMFRHASSTDEIAFAGEGEEITVGDQLGEYADYTEGDVNIFISTLKPRQQQIIRLTLEGKKQREIGEIIGISQVQVSRLTKQLFPVVEEYFCYPIGYFSERPTIREEEEEMKKMGKDKKPKAKARAKGDLERAKELLKTTKRTPCSIAKETGCTDAACYYWAKLLREPKEQEVKKEKSTENYYLKPVKIKDEITPETKEKIDKYIKEHPEAVVVGKPEVKTPNVQAGSITLVELGVPPVDLDADAAARKADEEHAEKMRAAEESAKLAEEYRQNLLNRSERSYGYSIVTRDVTPSDLHTLFTQVGHATSMSGIDKVNVSVVVTTESI